MAKKRIIFHGGAPKTGSTALQKKLGESAALLASKRVRYLPREVINKNFHVLHQVIRDLKKLEKAESALAKGRKILAQEFETADILIVSNEDSLFDEKQQLVRRSLFRSVDKQTAALKALFKGYDVTCFFVTRNWKTWLPSGYFQMVRQGETRSLRRFVQSLEEADLDWRLPIEALITFFGKENVFFITHEALRREPSFLYQHILKQCGIADPGPAEMPSVNKTYGIGTITYMRFWNWVFQLRKRSPKVRRFIRQKIYPWLTYWLKYSPAPKLHPSQRKLHHDRYVMQINELEELTRNGPE